MKQTPCLSSVCLLLALPAAAETAVTTAISYEAGNRTNQLLLAWEAIPTTQYRILTTAALGQLWPTLPLAVPAVQQQFSAVLKTARTGTSTNHEKKATEYEA